MKVVAEKGGSGVGLGAGVGSGVGAGTRVRKRLRRKGVGWRVEVWDGSSSVGVVGGASAVGGPGVGVRGGTHARWSLGQSHRTYTRRPLGVTRTAQPEGDGWNLVVRGSDARVVGDVAARLCGLRPRNPYTGQGIRPWSDRGQARKASKARKKS